MAKLLKIKQFFGVLVQHILLSNGVGPATTPETSGTGTKSLIDFLNGLLDVIVPFFTSIALKIYEILGLITYFISKIMLNVVDLIMVCVAELSGQSSSYSISSNSNLESTDIIFRFFLNEKVLDFLRKIFWFAFFVLILATIVALVKNEWNNANSDDKVKSPGRVLRNTIMSLLWMFLTPFIVIVSIVFCNVILTSGMNVLSGSNSTVFSMGSTVFSTSAHTANWYRNYADKGKKIPILFNYQGGFNNIDNSDTEEDVSGTEKIVSNADFTKTMFEKESFYTFGEIAQNGDNYYQIYDSDNLKTNRIEYYVMADFIDFAMDSGATFYIVNVEDVYKDAVSLYLTEGAEELRSSETSDQAYLLNDILSSIKPYYFETNDFNKETVITGPEDYKEKIIDGSYVVDNYKFVVSYDAKKVDKLNETTNQFVLDGQNGEYDYTVTSYAGSKDEADGAKYLYCVKIPITYTDANSDKIIREIFVPISQNITINDYYTFSSNYLSDAFDEEKEELVRPESYFIARGTFDENGYPTAIKQSGNQVVCYRHAVTIPSFFNYIPDFRFEPEEGDTSVGHSASVFVEDLLSYVTGVDVSALIPNYDIILEISSSNLKTLDEITRLDNGRFLLNYSFVNTQVKMNNIYNAQEINYFLLCLIGLSFVKVFLVVIFGLFKRIFDLTILWVTYPAYLAPHPLEGDDFSFNGSRFGKWRNSFINKLFMIWEVYLGLAFYYFFIKIIMQVDFHSWVGDMVYNAGGIVSQLKYSSQAIAMIAKILFMLAGLGMSVNIESSAKDKLDSTSIGSFKLADMIKSILLPGINPNIQGMGESFKGGIDALKDLSTMTNLAKDTYTPGAFKKAKNQAEKLAGSVTRAIPGAGLASRTISGAGQKMADSIQSSRTRRFAKRTTKKGVTDAVVTAETKKLEKKTDKFKAKSAKLEDVGNMFNHKA